MVTLVNLFECHMPATILSGYAKGEHRYFMRFEDSVAGRIAAMRTIRDFASDPEMNFSWFDAAKVARSITETSHGGRNHDDTEED